MNFFQNSQSSLRIRNENAFCNFKFQLCRINFIFINMLLKVKHKNRIQKLKRWNIHRKNTFKWKIFLPGSQSFDGIFQNPVAQSMNCISLLSCRYKIRRHSDSGFMVMPAYQRFKTPKIFPVEKILRLKVKFKFIIFEGFFNLNADIRFWKEFTVHGFPEKIIIIFAVSFDLCQCQMCVPEQMLKIHLWRGNCNAHRYFYLAFRKSKKQLSYKGFNVIKFFSITDNYSKFVAFQTVSHWFSYIIGLQDFPTGDDYFTAKFTAIQIIYSAKIVQVHKNKRKIFIFLFRIFNGLIQIFFKADIIKKTCKQIQIPVFF